MYVLKHTKIKEMVCHREFNLPFCLLDQQQFSSSGKNIFPTGTRRNWKRHQIIWIKKYIALVVLTRLQIEKNIYIVNVIVRVLEPAKLNFTILLASKIIAYYSCEVVMRAVLNTLYKSELSTTQLLMFMSEGVATMRYVIFKKTVRGFYT